MTRSDLYLPDADPGTPAEALDVGAMAKLLCCCEKSVWNFTKQGLLPQPIKMGKSARWFRPAVLAALKKLHAQAQAGDGSPQRA